MTSMTATGLAAHAVVLLSWHKQICVRLLHCTSRQLQMQMQPGREETAMLPSMTLWSHASVVPLHSCKGKEQPVQLTSTTRWIPDTQKVVLALVILTCSSGKPFSNMLFIPL